jgi:acetyl/propionyl-CoA carboxylase alpha subunit
LKIVGRKPLRVAIDDRVHVIDELAAPVGEFALSLDGHTVRGYRYDAGDHVFVRIEHRTFVIPRTARESSKQNRDELRADMPGTVIAIHVQIGQRVAAGDPLVTVESMKLQLAINSDRDGVVGALPIAVQSTFERGAVLVTIQEAP